MAIVYYPKNQIMYRRDTVSASYEELVLACNPNTILYFDTASSVTAISASVVTSASWADSSSWAVSASWAPQIGGGETTLFTGSTYEITSSWSNNSVSASRVNPAGVNGQIQYNNNGTLGAESRLVWNSSSAYLGVNEATIRVSNGSVIKPKMEWVHTGNNISYIEYDGGVDTFSTPALFQSTEFIGPLTGTSSWAVSASWAPSGVGMSSTSSWASNSLSSSIDYNNSSSTFYPIFVENTVGNFPLFTGGGNLSYIPSIGKLTAAIVSSAFVNASITITAPNISASVVTASVILATTLLGTSSWASQSISASWAPTSSPGTTLYTGSTYPITSSWSNNSVSASWAPGSPSVSASFADNAMSASYAPSTPSVSASYAASASVMTNNYYTFDTIVTGSNYSITCSFASPNQFVNLNTGSVIYVFTSSNVPVSGQLADTTIYLNNTVTLSTSSLSFPSSWINLGAGWPTSITASKSAMVSLRAYNADKIVGTYTVQL